MPTALAAVLFMPLDENGVRHAVLSLRGPYNWAKMRGQNGAGLYQPTAMGSVEEGESPFEAAGRELVEEVRLPDLGCLPSHIAEDTPTVCAGILTCWVIHAFPAGSLALFGSSYVQASSCLVPFSADDFRKKLVVVQDPKARMAWATDAIPMLSESAQVVKKAFETFR